MNNILLHIRLDSPLITLLSLGLFFGLFIFLQRRHKYGVYFKNILLLKEVYKKSSIYHRFVQIGIIIILCIFALLLGNPYIFHEREIIQKEANDIVFVFDVSYSMIADDIKPSRIEAAKNMFLELSDALGNNRLGLVLYAGKAFQSVPLTFDTHFIEQSIRDINIESLPQMRFQELQGTAIGDGLLMGLESLKSDEALREKIIILMTDGEENRGIESRKVIPLLKESETKVYTIAFGRDENATIQLRNQFGIPELLAVGGIDEILLREIANESGGEYYRATDRAAIEAIISSLSRLSTGIIEIEVYSFKKYLMKEGLMLLILLQVMLFTLFLTKKIRY